jgi:hypothetical protein
VLSGAVTAGFSDTPFSVGAHPENAPTSAISSGSTIKSRFMFMTIK